MANFKPYILYVMFKFSKQHFYLALSISIIAIPNLLLIVIGEDSVILSPLKKIVFFIFSMAFVIFPLVILRPKYFAIFGVLIAPLILFELFNVITFKVPSSQEAFASLFYTNQHESYELAQSNLIYGILFIILLCTLIFISIKLKKEYKLHKKQKFIIFISSILIFGTMYLRDYKIAINNNKSEGFIATIQETNYHYSVKLNKVFPLAIFLKANRFSENLGKIKNYNHQIKDFRFASFKKDTLTESEIYVLVIGETARKHNFGIFGYQRNTTPILSKTKNLHLFSNVKSAANLTAISLPFIVTRATPQTYEIGTSEPAILNTYKEAGFKTYWLTNQPAGIGGVYGFYSRLADVYKSVAISMDAAVFDERLFPEFEAILNDTTATKKFIIVHTQGSHFRYNFRYPKEFEKYTPVVSKGLSISDNTVSLKTEFANTYDNSILYTDYILSEFIKRLQQKQRISYLYYISDHGENLFDDKNENFLHGFNQPTLYETDIPLIIWNSEYYKLTYPNKYNTLQRNNSSKISTTNTFHTLLDLSNISYPEENLKQSFASKQFDTLQTRYLLNPNKKVIKLD